MPFFVSVSCQDAPQQGSLGAVGCRSELEVPGKQYGQKVEAAAEFGHFPDEMENDRMVCRSWIGC